MFSGIMKTVGCNWMICDMEFNREAKFNKDEEITDSDIKGSGLMVSSHVI